MKSGSKTMIWCVLLLFLVFGAGGVAGWCAETVDDSLYAGLLKKYVKNGWVDYRGLKNEEAELDRYLEALERVDTSRLSRDAQLAFYINAYNAWTVKLILGAYPGVKSIKDLGTAFSSPWKKEICRIDRRVISLDELEHKIIRARFHDPRVHFAVNCASKSCPSLSSEPYQEDALNGQLDAAAGAFINNPERNRLEGAVLHVSKIFDWYGDDFKDGVVAYFLKYAKGVLRTALEAEKGRIKIEYLDYDWSLNGE